MRKGQKISIIISIIFVYALLAVFSFVLLGCNRYKKFVVTFETYGYGVIESQTVLYGQTAVKPPDPMQNGCKFGGWHTDPLKTAAFDFETAIKSDIILYAKYIKTYIVSFETLCFCEGFCTHVIPPVVTAEFSIIPFPADPLREGCEFTGWFLDADCLTPCEEGQRVTEDIILYAGWERIFYTLSFELCGGGDNFSQIVRVGEATSEPPAPKWDGHTFLGWFWDEEGAYRFEFGHILDLDWTLYALWAPVKENSYRVTFRLIYPKILSEEYLPAGSVIECPDDPHADGYRFCGWYADALFTLPFGFGEELHADTDVYARFVALYFVVFFDNECVFCTLAVEDGALVLPPDDPAREGFVFGGWYADAGLTEKFNFDKPITRNSVAYARYLSLFVCEFFDGNEFLFRESVIEGGVIENPSGREKDGFVFDGWFLDAGLTERFNFDRSITQNIVIYAKYLSIFVCGFYDGEELLFSKTVVEGNILERPAANPEKENFEFGGWFSDAELAEEFIFGLPITAETRVCAKFIRLYRFSAFVSGIAIYDIFLEERTVPPFDLSVNPDPQENHVFKGWCLDPEYTQIYEAVPICEDTFIYARFVRLYVLKVFDGSELMGREMLEEGTKPILDTPFKPGFDFCGWFLDFELMLPYDFAPIYCDITLYVKFEPLPPNKFFVVFMSICGEKLGGYLLEDGEIIYAMDVVPPAGTRFGGWFSSPDCEDEFIFGIGIFEDTAVYLLFIKVYTVSFWAGGEEIAVFTVDEGEIILPVASLSPPDYHEFIGWFEIGESCGAFDFAVLIYRDIALKAVFKRITVTVRFVISEGTKQIATVKAGQTVTAPQNPEDGVCVFMGWYSDRELTALFDFDAPIFEDTEVFASWRQKSIFTVKFFGHDEVLLLCVKVLEFDPVIPPTPPAVKYYTFSYWTESDALSRVTANVSCFSVYVYDSTDPDGFGYVPYRGGYLINSVITMENRLILPVEYDGLPVLGVADTASGILALKSVSFIFIPSSYVYIGKNAFCRASDMELEVEFGKNPQVHYIGDFAFRGVRTDFVPLDVESIGVGAFMYAILARAHMYNIKSIGEFAFAYAYIGELVWYCGLDLPDSVFYYAEITLASFDEFEAMGERAFYAAEITGVLILPSSLKTIGRLAFSLCLLEEIVLPDSVDTIGASVFAKMPNLKKINIPASLLQIAESAFSDCPALTSVTFAKASLLAGIGASAFKNTAIAGIALPGTVTRIEGFAFSSSALTGIKLPMFLATLDFCAFEDCGSLQNITIPSDSLNLNFVNSDYLNYATFGGFVVESGNRYFSARGDIHLYDLGGERLVVFIDCQSYACPASLKLIESRAFMGKTALKVVKISEKVVSIGDYAFAGSQAAPMNLIAVDFSDAASLAYIGEGAFMYNTALIQADLAGCSSLISLPKDCFFGASGLNLIKLPAQIKMIGENAFAFDSATGSGIAALDLTQYTSLEEIKTDAFANRTGLIEVKFPSSLKVLSGFNGCTNLANAVFADGTIEIGAYAFFGCILSDAFTVPDSVKSIGEFAFAHSGITVFAPTAAFSGLGAGAFSCSRLTSVDLSWTSLVAIGAHAFLGAGGLKTVVFPAGLERIGELAFAQTDLMEVGLPPSVEIVGGGAFMGCKGLTDVYFGNSAGGSELSIFDITPFEGCSKLKNIYIFALKPPMLIAPALGIANTGGPEYGKLADLKIFVPSGCLEAYKNADYFGQSCWQFHLDRLYEMP